MERKQILIAIGMASAAIIALVAVSIVLRQTAPAQSVDSVSAVLVDTFVSYKIMGVFWTIVACGTRVAAAGPDPA